MAMSPAKRHLARAAARTGSAPIAKAARPSAAEGEYLLQRAALGVDLRRLKEIQSTEKKIELKRELLPAYDAWIEGVLAADNDGKGGAQDDIVTHMLIWRIDVGDYEAALPLADYVLRHNLTLPERFTRTAGTLIAEETAEAALKAFGQDLDFNLDVLRRVDDLTEIHDMPDQVRAKLEKALGLKMARIADAMEADADGVAGGKRAALEKALKHLRRALELDTGCGVKKETQRLEREIRKLAAIDGGEA
ncbi:phage terminase small subunit [Sphingomonas sp. ac-8]|uniref:phage terminase small subunit n=1 Tax=Sphingomonas sp. ac-8 TaxID=3242977 RepID=UPI003A800B38